MPVKKNQKDAPKSIIIQQVDIRQIVRTVQDIQTWRNAIRSAESIINPTRRLLYDLYEEIKLDGHLESVVAKRITAITNQPLRFIDKAGKDVPLIMDMIDTEAFETILTEVLNSKLWGYTLMEIGFNGNNIIPTLIPRQHVKPELGIVTRTPYDMTGLNYMEDPYRNTCIFAGTPKDLGLYMKVAQYVIYKRGGFGDWSKFAEIFGMPFRKGTYDPMNPSSREEMISIMDEMGAAPYTVVPVGCNVEIIPNSGNSGSNDVYKEFKNACNEEISVCIVGQTMTTDNGSSRSQAEVHQGQQDQIHEADKRFVRRVLNERLVPILAGAYPGVDGGKFVFPEVDKTDKKTRLEMDIQISNKVPIEDDYFYNTYNIPKPENYDELKALQEEQKNLQIQTLKQVQGDKNGISNLFRNFFV